MVWNRAWAHGTPGMPLKAGNQQVSIASGLPAHIMSVRIRSVQPAETVELTVVQCDAQHGAAHLQLTHYANSRQLVSEAGHMHAFLCPELCQAHELACLTDCMIGDDDCQHESLSKGS